MEGLDLIAYNFLTGKSCALSPSALDVLLQLSEWKKIAALVRVREEEKRNIPNILLSLLEFDLIVVEGTQESLRDADYIEEWEWGVVAGLYHFTIRNAQWVDQEQSNKFIEAKFSTSPPPELFQVHGKSPDIFNLNNNVEINEMLSLMAERRSSREFAWEQSLQIDILSDCLFSGFGITEVRGAPPIGPYPLKMTPSGGARNPFDAVVYIRNVTSLEPGVYRYSGYSHSLVRIVSDTLPSIVDILSGQLWADSAAAVIFLVANFERTMWKYPHPNGYRVVLIEAGHIAQNIVLLATKHKIKSVTTAAIRDSLAEEAFGIKRMSQSVCYAIALGNPLTNIS